MVSEAECDSPTECDDLDIEILSENSAQEKFGDTQKEFENTTMPEISDNSPETSGGYVMQNFTDTHQWKWQ